MAARPRRPQPRPRPPASTACPQTRTGISFPQLGTRDLDGREVTLPAGLPGEWNVVIIAFQRQQQELVDSIVTRNLKDFPESGLQPWDIEAKSPDAFVLDQVHIDIGAMAASVRQIADSRTNPPQAIEDVLTQLERDGLA